tara:strand:+ start:58 stop:846 length:789 start_codon:yes stop_codon:yes gene_type:complete
MNSETPSSDQKLSQESSDVNEANDSQALKNEVTESVASKSDLGTNENPLDTTSFREDSQPENPDVATSQETQIADNEARLEQVEKEHETLKSQYMRIAADFDNFRKRQTRDNDDLRIQLTCTTLSEILPVVDNFERARQQLNPEGEEAQALHRSYQGLYKQLVDVFKQLGVAPMRVVGQTFDPSLHEAVLREPSEEHLEDIVTEELQRGYHLDGRVLRHALVKVSMGPGPSSSINKTSIEDESLNDDSKVEPPDPDPAKEEN